MVVGQVARDLVLRVEEAPGAGRAARVRDRREILGGKGANQGVGLSQLGVSTGLIGVVAGDHTADTLLEQARADDLDVSHVVRRGTETALIVDVVDDRGQWRYLEHIPDEMLVTEADVHAASSLIGRARSVLVQLQQPRSTALAAARAARTAGARVVLDGAPREGDVAELLAEADVLRADAHEASALVGGPLRDVSDAVEGATALLRRGPAFVVLELAGEGNLFASREGHEFLPLLDAEVVDTTGGGDALVAAFTAALQRGEHRTDAARASVRAAAATVGHAGGRPRLGSWLLDRASSRGSSVER